MTRRNFLRSRINRYKLSAGLREKFTVNGQTFILSDRSDGYFQIYPIHPYDETEYHWAKGKNETWNIYRKGNLKFRTNRMNYEEVAEKCLELDRKEGLERTGGIW